MASLIVGVGCLAGVAALWALHFFRGGNVALGTGVVLVGLLLAAASIARVPAALVVVLGGAIVVATAFLVGAGGLVLPPSFKGLLAAPAAPGAGAGKRLVGAAQAPNPSIERTCQRPLRAIWPAAHVER